MATSALLFSLLLSLGSCAVAPAHQQAHQQRAAAAQSYAIDTTFKGETFFNGFDFFTGQDPNNGFVTYMSSQDAFAEGMVTQRAGKPMYMGVDYNTTLSTSGPGRKSVRLTSKKSWTHGLFIADILHMPDSTCGTWPAFWLLGPNWPYNGEIDIMEGINRNTHNLMSMHTGPNCVMTAGEQYGSSHSMQCDGTQNDNSGCGVGANSSAHYTFGSAFSHEAGGVYATEWTSEHIKIWFFPRMHIPKDIHAGKPNPSTWGKPQGNFQGGKKCDIDSHFKDMSIVINTNFCGGWAEGAYKHDKVCKAAAPTCPDYVAANAAHFENSYWEIYSVKVYQLH